MKDKINNLISEIGELVDKHFDGLQGWDDLYDWPIDESRNLGGNLVTKVIHGYNHLRFVTYIPPEGEFPKHHHDCTEICKVLSGTLADKMSPRRATADQVVTFPLSVPHRPHNPSKDKPLWIQVDFHR